MDIPDIRKRIESKIAIAESNQSIKQARNVMSTETNKHRGQFTEEERGIIKENKGQIAPVLKRRAELAAPGLLSQLQAGKAPQMTTYERDAVLTLSTRSAPTSAAPASVPTPAAAAPVPSNAAPVAAKPTTEAPAPKPTATAPTPELTGLARATAVHQGKAMTPAAPKELSGLERATAAHKENPKASTTSAPSGKVDISGLSGLERATAAHKAAAAAKKK